MIKNFIYIITSLIIFSSCNITIEECEGFPDSELKYIPYRVDDIIQYYNGNDTISFNVIDFFKSKPYEIKGSFPQTGFDDCSYTGFYETNKDSEFGYRIKDEYYGGIDITIESQNNDEVFRNSIIDNDYQEFYDSYEISENQFNEVTS